MNIEFCRAAQMSLEEIAATVTRGFEGYFVPIRVDATALLNAVRVDSVDLEASIVTLRGGKAVGVALVARRGWTSRLAAMSIEPQSRGQRIGSQLTQHLIQAAPVQATGSLVWSDPAESPWLRLIHRVFKDFLA